MNPVQKSLQASPLMMDGKIVSMRACVLSRQHVCCMPGCLPGCLSVCLPVCLSVSPPAPSSSSGAQPPSCGRSAPKRSRPTHPPQRRSCLPRKATGNARRPLIITTTQVRYSEHSVEPPMRANSTQGVRWRKINGRKRKSLRK